MAASYPWLGSAVGIEIDGRVVTRPVEVGVPDPARRRGLQASPARTAFFSPSLVEPRHRLDSGVPRRLNAAEVIDLVKRRHQVGVARCQHDEIHVRSGGFPDTRKRTEHVDALLLRAANGDLVPVDVPDRLAIGSELEGVLQISELHVDTIRAPLRRLIHRTPVLLPVVVDVMKPTEDGHSVNRRMLIPITLTRVALQHGPLGELHRVNERIVPIPTRVEHVVRSQVNVLVVDNDGRSKHETLPKGKKIPANPETAGNNITIMNRPAASCQLSVVSDTYSFAMTLSPSALPIATVVIAAVLSYLFARLGASIEGKREHQRWLREQRFGAYARFLATADKWATRAKGPDAGADWDPGQEFYDEMTTAESAVELLGPDDVVAAMDPIRSAVLHLQEVHDPGAPSAAQAYWSHQRTFVLAAQQQLHPPAKFLSAR